MAVADSSIVCFAAKYQSEFWRPFTAIPAGDTDNNPATVADLTVAATEKVTRKTLTAEDQKRLVEDALEIVTRLFTGDVVTYGKPHPEPYLKASTALGYSPADVLAVGERGEKDALRLILDWRRVFGRWNTFSWSGRRLERRVAHDEAVGDGGTVS